MGVIRALSLFLSTLSATFLFLFGIPCTDLILFVLEPYFVLRWAGLGLLYCIRYKVGIILRRNTQQTWQPYGKGRLMP